MICNLCSSEDDVEYVKFSEGEYKACKQCRESYERFKNACDETEV